MLLTQWDRDDAPGVAKEEAAAKGSRSCLTKAIYIGNLCVPCYNHCRYCLLQWNGSTIGIDYERSVAYARRFYLWLSENRPDLDFMYYFGYSMEHPRLRDAIRFLRETGSVGAEFLQFDGMKQRSGKELRELFAMLKEEGVKRIQFTFYGAEKYHDHFSERKGDFQLMELSLAAAMKEGLKTEIGIPVTKENLDQMQDLVKYFSSSFENQLPEQLPRLYLFTPHSGGRGICLLKSKLTLEDYEKLAPGVQKLLNRQTNRTPSEWMDAPPQTEQNRVLLLSLLHSNIDSLETQPFDETLAQLEAMDEAYYAVMPSFLALLQLYADPDDHRLYSQKDLKLLYQRRFIEENHLALADITDERFSGSIRY